MLVDEESEEYSNFMGDNVGDEVEESDDSMNNVVEDEVNFPKTRSKRTRTKKEAYASRKIICERQVQSDVFAKFECEEVRMLLMRYGLLRKLYEPIGPFYPELVKEFYMNASHIDFTNRSIVTRVRNKTFTITGQDMAKYWIISYPRNPVPTRLNYGTDLEYIVSTLSNTGMGAKPYKPQGELNIHFRMLNMILWWNMFTRGDRINVNEERLKFYYWMRESHLVDFPYWIWSIMNDIITSTDYSSSLPFGILVSHLCVNVVKVKPKDGPAEVKPGMLRKASFRKSDSLSITANTEEEDVSKRRQTQSRYTPDLMPGMSIRLRSMEDSVEFLKEENKVMKKHMVNMERKVDIIVTDNREMR